MDARNDSGICTVKRERDFILRPLQRTGRHGQQGGTTDNSKHTELFHDRSSLTIFGWMVATRRIGRLHRSEPPHSLPATSPDGRDCTPSRALLRPAGWY